MHIKYEIGDLVSGSNFSENFRGQELTAIGVVRGTDQPVIILRCHPEASPVLLTDVDGNPLDFLVVSESHMTPIPEATAKFGNYWSRRRALSPVQEKTTRQAMRESKAA